MSYRLFFDCTNLGLFLRIWSGIERQMMITLFATLDFIITINGFTHSISNRTKQFISDVKVEKTKVYQWEKLYEKNNDDGHYH